METLTDSLAAVERPESAEGVADIIAAARRLQKRLRIRADGSLDDWWTPQQADATLDLTGLSGVTLYRPTELVIAAKAGTPLKEVEDTLAENGQMLTFEPPDLRALLGSTEAEPTIGGAVMANLSGPRRLSAGALRDSLVGVRLVNGLGEQIVSGGRVMKNVTGLDLCRLLAGSHGSLAALTEATFKVLPRPETERTLVIMGQDAATAQQTMSAAMAEPFEVSCAGHLPAAVAARSGIAAIAGDSATVLRLEFLASFVESRAERLLEALGLSERTVLLDQADSRALWQFLRDVRGFAADLDRGRTLTPVWRLSVVPTEAPDVIAAISSKLSCEWHQDWAGGLIWLRVTAGDADRPDAGAETIRAAVAGRGHATLIRASADQRMAAGVFHPEDTITQTLSRRIKTAFDPDHVFLGAASTG